MLDKDYTQKQYTEQFKIRIPENLNKIARIQEIYQTQVKVVPEMLYYILGKQHDRLIDALKKFGDYPSPFSFY